MPIVNQKLLDQATTNSYVKHLTVQTHERTKGSIIIKNTDSVNDAKVKILASNDTTGSANSYAEELAEAVLTAGSTLRHTLTGAFAWIQVQVTDNVGGNHATISAWYTGVGI